MPITRSNWTIQRSALAVMIKPLRPFIPKPCLSLICATETVSDDRDYLFARRGEVLTAMIPEADVNRLLDADARGPALHLILSMRALFLPGAPTRRWQWGIKLVQDGAALPCAGQRGISLAPDADGFVRSAVCAFPASRGHGSDEWELVLQEHRAAAAPALWTSAERAASCAQR